MAGRGSKGTTAKAGKSAKPQSTNKRETRDADSEGLEEGQGSESGFNKFPRTYHILNSGGSAVSRDDLVMGDVDVVAFLNPSHDNVISIEEKVDGANLGISIDASGRILTQNRSHYVNSQTHRQFSALDAWISEHEESLRSILRPGSGDTLFGEWLFAVHSIRYTRLPSYFLAFDIFDGSACRFISSESRNTKLRGTGIRTVRTIARDSDAPTTKEGLLALLETRSAYYDGAVEGVYIRLDERTQNAIPTATDSPSTATSTTYHSARSKLVRPDFMQAIDEHWTKKDFTKNILDMNAAYSQYDEEDNYG